MSSPGDEHLALARVELGEPDALFQVSPRWFLAKLGVGLGLLLFGLTANYWWWVHGPRNADHMILHLLIWPPAVGAGLLVHMYRQRGLLVLIYPTGLLRLKRGEVESYPWSEIAQIRMKLQQAEGVEYQYVAGEPTAAWLPVEVPSIQIWNAWLTLERSDGATADFGPALSEYALFAEEVQRRTFRSAWAATWPRFLAGETVAFGDLEVNRSGLRIAGKVLRWGEMKEMTIGQGRLSIKQVGRWVPWVIQDVSSIPNPHVLFALVVEMRKHPLAATPTEEKPADGEERRNDASA